MNRSTHPVEQEQVMAYLDGELSAERAASVAVHLEQCAECRVLAEELRLVSRRVATWQVEPPPARLAEHVTAALAERSQEGPEGITAAKWKFSAAEPTPRRPLLRRWVLGFAGVSVVLLFAVAISIPNLLRSRTSYLKVNEGKVQPSEERYAAGANQQDRTTPERSGSKLSGRRDGVVAPTQPADPMIVRTASLTIISKEFENARAAIEQIVRRQEGYIAHLSTSGQSRAARSLAARLRVPADRLDATLAELKKLGRVEQESQTGEEVTQQYVDLVARLSNARNTEQRLIQVLRRRTGKVADILAVEKEIARVREQIERMEAKRKNLEDRVGFATLELRLKEEHKAALEVAPPSTSLRLWNEMVEGYRSAVASALGLLIFLLRYGPSLLFWLLVLFWPVRFAWRRLRAFA